MLLEEHSARLLKSRKCTPGSSGRPATSSPVPEEHVFLVLDKNVQGLPWESLPILRGRSVSRIPCVDFLHDRLAFAELRRKQRSLADPRDGTAVVNAKNGYFILNPSGDLKKTEGRFQGWVDEMRAVGWDGVVGAAITEHQFSEALKNRDLVVYVLPQLLWRLTLTMALGTLDMVVGSSTFALTVFGAYLPALRPCSGDVHQERSRKWVISIELGHHTTTCWLAGELLCILLCRANH